MTIPALANVSVPGTTLSGREILVSLEVPATAVGSSRYAEVGEAAVVVVVVRSNVPWTLVVRTADLATQGIVEVRAGRGEYRPVRPDGLVLAQGRPGVHEIVLDYRINLNGGAGWNGGRALTLVFAVEG